MGDDMQAGAYESLHTAALDAALSASPFTPRYAVVSGASAPEVLARHVAETLTRALSSIADPAAQIATVNELLTRLTATPDPVVALEQLVTLTEQVSSGVHRLIPEPTIKLSDVALLTNAKDQPNLGAALGSELGSADRVDLLCAFIRYSGIRIIRDQLRQLRDRAVPFRVLTTTYMGATERRAIDQLVRDLGADVRISYNARSTRLHAKAWLFHRSSGFDTGFVGSSNLSHAAMVDGLEWNVRISGVATPTLVRQFSAAFDTYWNDDAFVPYDPDVDGERLQAALDEAHGPGVRRPANTAYPLVPQDDPAEASPAGLALVPRLTVVPTPSGPQVRPYPHQEQMLEVLDVERKIHDRHRNLLVAATGTGKTVVAALDYLRLCERAGTRPTLLFVAHRREILQQSLRTYRDVLGDASFGEEFVDGARPTQWRHVFASIQGLAGLDLDPTQFAVVVIDEFHHAEAPTYRRLLDTLRPQELLGLTATPERTDGVDVRSFFDGRTAHELRLWDALEQDLLCPFHYYGIADGTDLRDVEWTRGAYDVAGLSEVYTGNDARARVVISALRDTVNDPGSIRALGFCVSVAHAEYMARVFTEAGLPALAVSGTTSRDDRDAAFAALRAGEVRCLFAVDLFNEGLDLPDVDTLLLLRPTQSATVFLQQLGRGLRRTPDKAVLTVLDFIGQQRREFRFDVRFRALTGGTRSELERDIQAGFPFLPSGCRIVLDQVAQQTVLGNVRAALSLNQRKEMVADVRSHGEATLAEYLRASGHELADVYRKDGSWTGLRRAASLVSSAPGPSEAALLKRMSALAHVDDPERAEVYRLLASATAPSYASLHPRWQHLARMLFFTLWPNKGGHESFGAGLATLREHPAVGDEVSQLMDVVLDRIHHVPQALSPALAHLPVLSHATYRREELLAGLNWATWERSARGNITGVAWSEDERVDALMINLHKDDAGFSPTTMYRDYPISRDLFHWESQNATSTASPAGRRYTDGSASTVLFVRDRPTDEMGAAPFLCLGAADHVEHRGEKPIAITWRLHRAMPVEVLQSAAVVAS
jgi:superfamily II DNA or RNA helicase/HKD family nuclease